MFQRSVALLMLLCPTLMMAAPVGRVRLIQAPAWRITGDIATPLRPGDALAGDETLRTGAGGRVLVALDEGSLVKLGAEAELVLRDVVTGADDEAVFRGFFDVLKGAFRFTTTVVGRRRDLDIRVRTATIGIRGTDVWGKTEAERDFVVLLEGRIEIERGGNTYTLDQPQSLFMAPRDAEPLPVGPVDGADLARWAAETEPAPGSGVLAEDGRFRLHLVALPEAYQATRLVERLAADGLPAAQAEAQVEGRTWQRVYVDGYASRADAEAAGAALAGRYGFGSPWVATP